ncbi:MAG: hypothetical protein ACPL7B_08880, partial [Candidatus Poribacteria bacterium]
IQNLIDDLIKEKDGIRSISDNRGSIIRFYISGRTNLNKEIRDKEVEIMQILKEDENDRKQFAWVESIVINTRPYVDISSRKQIDDFVGEFLKVAESLKTSSNFKSEMLRILTSIPEHSVIAEQLSSLTEEDFISILEDAESIGLDWLMGEED